MSVNICPTSGYDPMHVIMLLTVAFCKVYADQQNLCNHADDKLRNLLDELLLLVAKWIKRSVHELNAQEIWDTNVTDFQKKFYKKNDKIISAQFLKC